MSETKSKTEHAGMNFPRKFTTEGKNPLEEVDYEKRDCAIIEPDGKIVFEMKGIDVPSTWSQLAADILISKYVRKAGVPGTGNEVSAKQVVFRIANTIRKFGEEQGYFKSTADAQAFEDEVLHLLINQKAAFNSPVWFNCGLFQQYGIKGSGGNFAFDFEKNKIIETDSSYERPQCSACFINSVGDDLMSIFGLVRTEAKLFKYGSGTGTNFSKLRGRNEKLSGGGKSSGLMSFLEVFDRAAGSIKSGGTTRRAAKMVCLDMDHPEIVDFINWKVKEEKKVKALIDAGYPSDFNGEAYKTVGGQNSNNSVRISDEFMNAVLSNGKWKTKARTGGEIMGEYDAKDLMRQICTAAWHCADPGVQFDTIINDWHTCSNTDKIRASNPCSEFMFIDDSACNLASINLLKFVDDDGNFQIDDFKHACKIVTTAQEIIVDAGSYPTESIAKNSHDFRPLGLGYANLGTMLMINGIPYESDKAFAIAGVITSVMTATAYKTSAELALVKGTFNGFQKNREPMLRVMNKHRDAAYKLDIRLCPKDLINAAREEWDEAIRLGEKHGYRNAQTTLLAPTGTIGLLMDCDTTGIEPDYAIVKWKKLAGGGYFKIVNQSIPRALQKLGYSDKQIEDIIFYILGHGTIESAPHINPDALNKLGYTDNEIVEAVKAVRKTKKIDENTPYVSTKALNQRGLTAEQIEQAKLFVEGAGTIEGAPHLKEEHVSVFDCASKCGKGKRFISPMGHVKMMAAVQPHLSGAISKTVNVPNESTVDDIEKIYFESWKMGLKSVALYRDGCKLSQPLNTSSSSLTENKEKKASAVLELPKGVLLRGQKLSMPQRRKGITIASEISGNKIFLRTGEYDDGKLGEIFIDMHKEGAAFRSMMNCFAIAVSVGLQYGVPLTKYVDAFTFTRFEPNGFTDHPNVRTCTSIIDFIFRVLGMEYLGRTDFVQVKPVTAKASFDEIPGEDLLTKQNANEIQTQLASMMGDAPICNVCGHVTVRNGACYRCLNCGNSLGCS